MIYGPRLRFRGPERTDIPRFVAWLNDPEVRANLLISLPISQANEEAWFESMLASPQAQQPFVMEVQVDGQWTPLGNCGVHQIDWRCRSGEVGIFIGEKQCWNQGYGTEAMQMLLRHGFNTLNLNRIALDVYRTNPGAIRAYEKAGFVHEGCRRQAMYKNGQYVDILQMSVLRSEWQDPWSK